MAISEVPEATINFEVFDENAIRQLGVAEVTLPELNQLSVEISGAGMAGKLEVPIEGMFESIEVKLTWRTLYENPVAIMKQGGFMYSLRGAMQAYEASNGKVVVVPVHVDVRGRHSATNLGSFKTGELTETETTLVCDYVKITVDSNVWLTFDFYNFVYEVDSVDYMSDIRAALGLNG